ncbi:hypothetical protein C8F01DRAFT_1018913 [Mycena amicta]|nr:hypothetical protein C8F01DRAFT_1018913 [Mycena amicta]
MPSPASASTSTLAKPAKFKTPTCALCRKRKLRCDGGNPCGPCTRTRTPVVCTYIPKTVGQLRSELPKGGACITCRQRKRRCDGNFPCRTCTQAGRPDECKYRDKAPSAGKHKQAARQRRDLNDSGSDSASTSSESSSRQTTPQYPENTPGELRLHADDMFATQGFNPEVDLNGLDSLFSWDALGMPMQCGFEHRGSCSSESSSSTSSACPDNTLSTLRYDYPAPLPRTSCSESTIARTLVLEHRFHYGLNLPQSKVSAIANGDLSGQHVHPALVHAAELLGYVQRYQAHPDGWLSFNSQSAAEVELEVLVRDALDDPQGIDPLTTLQIYMVLAVYYCQKEDICAGQECLVKASNLLAHPSPSLGLDADFCSVFNNSNDAKFDSSSSSPLAPHTHAEEVRAALAQVIYMDLGAQLVVNLPSSLDPALVDGFRRLMAVHQDASTNFLRAKSFLLLLDAQNLVSAWNRWQFGPSDPAPSAWSKRYRSLIAEIQPHIEFVNSLILDISSAYIPAPEDAQALCTLRECLIAGYGALAALYGLFAPRDPSGSAAKQLRDAVGEIVRITQEFTDRDFEFLDPPLSVPWSIASRSVDAAESNTGNLGQTHGFASQATLFFHECNMRLRQASPFMIPL